jgi:hypothetical protein
MAVEFNSMIGSVTSGAGTTGMWILIIVAVVVVLALIFGLGFWYWNAKKRWNLRVEFKLPRSDGKMTQGEWGKGSFNSTRGVVYLKRNKMKKVPMEVFDIKKYLQGTDLLTVIQIGPEDYRPVLNDSWSEVVVEYENPETGEVKRVREAIMNLRVDTGVNKAWKSSWESAAKKAYSITSFFQQFQTPIAVGIVVICVFVGFAIIWTRLPTICH